MRQVMLAPLFVGLMIAPTTSAVACDDDDTADTDSGPAVAQPDPNLTAKIQRLQERLDRIRDALGGGHVVIVPAPPPVPPVPPVPPTGGFHLNFDFDIQIPDIHIHINIDNDNDSDET